jgi:hypothetical protein
VTEYGTVVSSVPTGEPSSLNWTPETASLSAAVAASVSAPETEPAAGEVMATVGAVVSQAEVDAVSGACADTFPEKSTAWTVRFCDVAHGRPVKANEVVVLEPAGAPLRKRL